MSRNAISDVEGLISPLPTNDHALEDEEGEPLHGDPVENVPDNVDEYEQEEDGDNEYENDGFIVGDEEERQERDEIDDMPHHDVGDVEELAVEEDEVGSEDELADFIVDEDGNGHLNKRDHKKRKYMRDANEIFSDVHELLLIRKDGKKA